MSEAFTRRVSLDGPVNFRDIGGYAVGDGNVRTGRVFRSDSLHHLSKADGPRLAEIGIASAIDFRAYHELLEIGIGRLGEFDIRHVHCPTTDKVLNLEHDPDVEMPGSAAEMYMLMIKSGGRSYAEALRTLATPGNLPCVYFCMAGKDRTGLFSAVLLGLLGVRDDDIVADYVLTHEVLDQIHARARAGRRIETDVRIRIPEDMLGAHAATMENTIVGVREQWGSWEGYAESLGVAPEVLSTLRAELVA